MIDNYEITYTNRKDEVRGEGMALVTRKALIRNLTHKVAEIVGEEQRHLADRLQIV